MPYNMVESALYYHNPRLSGEENRELVSMIHIADCCWNKMDKNYEAKFYREILNEYKI